MSVKNIHTKSIIEEGKAYNEIVKAMNEEDLDLVVMSASGIQHNR